MTKLTKQNEKFVQDVGQEIAKKKFKHRIVVGNFRRKIRNLVTNTLMLVLWTWCILFQRYNQQLKVVSHLVKLTTTDEAKYNSCELETLAVFTEAKHFRVYLLDIRFKLVTDCSSPKSFYFHVWLADRYMFKISNLV